MEMSVVSACLIILFVLAVFVWNVVVYYDIRIKRSMKRGDDHLGKRYVPRRRRY